MEDDVNTMYLVRRDRYLEHNQRSEGWESCVYSSFDRALRYLRKRLTDEKDERLILTIDAYVVDAGTDNPARTWNFTEKGVPYPETSAQEIEAGRTTGKFKLGDIVRILPRRTVGPLSPCHTAEFGVVTREPVQDDNGEYESHYVAHYLDWNGFLRHFRVTESLLKGFDDELPAELRILAVISEHFRGVHPLDPETRGRIFDDPSTYLKNAVRFDFNRVAYVPPAKDFDR